MHESDLTISGYDLNSHTPPLIIAHRGIAARYPENTRVSFEAAINARADAFECDVQLTADHELIVCHDPTMDRYGHPGIRIDQSRLEDLQTLDIGRWFSPEFSEQRFLSLTELLRDFAPRIQIFLELKIEDATDHQIDAIISRVVKNISEVAMKNISSHLHILCFNVFVLQRIQKLLPAIPLVWNTSTPHQITDHDLTTHSWLAAIDGRITEMSSAVVTKFRRHNLDVFSFTCNSEDEVRKAHTLQLDGIITDDPDSTRAIISQIECAE